MARIPAVTRDAVPEDQRGVFDAFVERRGQGVPTSGPFSLVLHIPEMAKRLEDLRTYLRQEPSLPQKLQELAMLTTARELDCLFIWNAHAAAGRSAGLRDDIVDNLRDKVELTGLSPEETTVLNLGREYFRTCRISKSTFDTAQAQLGLRGLMTLVNLMGCYALLAINMNILEMELPAGATEKPLPV